MDSPQRETTEPEQKERLKLSLSAGDLKLDLEANRWDELDEEFISSLQRFFDLADQECISKRRFEELHRDDAFLQNAMSLGLVIFFALMLVCPTIWALTRRDEQTQPAQSSTNVEALSC